MAEYILQILKSQLFILLSWGFHSPSRIENGLRFYVNGFIHTGAVEVIYNEGIDLFEVKTLTSDGIVKQMVESVYIDNLITVIDNLVEHCDNYEEKVNITYGL